MPSTVTIVPCEKIGGAHLTCTYPDVITLDEAFFHIAVLRGAVNTEDIGAELNQLTNVLTLRCFVWSDAA